MAYTLSTFVWIYHIEIDALGDGLIGAFRLTDIAIDAFFGNQESQESIPIPRIADAWLPAPWGLRIRIHHH